ncbi:hypothetical protein CYLTODRAFT_493629 [Cylindrobasidium torrendii FP15055 ss-10]|uniref:Uncharacterized protein n=1 Tax=Cylindrobasidium torrendii FP15055 ss-10 TaxID=1314674 RepID=A0A0D7AZZ0_9AGAR|nr:hypothetical protein CYLTODRAFT_493629 [Cylindrobasidium torrendii FP15055 ss-10]
MSGKSDLSNVVLQAGARTFRVQVPRGTFGASPIQLADVEPKDVELVIDSLKPIIPRLDIVRQVVDANGERVLPLVMLALAHVETILPAGRTFEGSSHDWTEDALVLAVQQRTSLEMRKKLWYHVVTTREFHDDVVETHSLPKDLRTKCKSLLDNIIADFTALLFTPPPASHMECTDVIADSWMSEVISPALANDGVYRPLESLDAMKQVDWKGLGVCDSCVKGKHEEWDVEADEVWRKLGGWIE